MTANAIKTTILRSELKRPARSQNHRTPNAATNPRDRVGDFCRQDKRRQPFILPVRPEVSRGGGK